MVPQLQWAVIEFFLRSALIAFVDKEQYGCEQMIARVDDSKSMETCSFPGDRACWLGQGSGSREEGTFWVCFGNGSRTLC